MCVCGLCVCLFVPLYRLYFVGYQHCFVIYLEQTLGKFSYCLQFLNYIAVKRFKVKKQELIEYSGLRDTEANFNNITNINSQINVIFYYLSNETNPIYV